MTLHCFSHVRDVLGERTLSITLPEPATTGDVLAHVRRLGGDRLGGLPMRIALNRDFVDEAAPLSEGDEIALIPPVQGG